MQLGKPGIVKQRKGLFMKRLGIWNKTKKLKIRRYLLFWVISHHLCQSSTWGILDVYCSVNDVLLSNSDKIKFLIFYQQSEFQRQLAHIENITIILLACENICQMPLAMNSYNTYCFSFHQEVSPGREGSSSGNISQYAHQYYYI